MERNYRVAYWSNEFAEKTLNDPQVRYRNGSTPSASWSSTFEPTKSVGKDIFLPFNEYNIKLREKFSDIASRTESFSAGLFQFCGWTRLGACGLIVHEGDRIILLGDAVGWGVDFAKWYTEREFQARWADDLSEMTFDVDKVAPTIVMGTSCCLAAPGQDIYGHWLLDYIPRIFSATLVSQGDLPLRIRSDRPWIREFLNVLEIRHRCYDFSSDSVRIQFEKILTPSFLKRGYIINMQNCLSAWLDLRKLAEERFTNGDKQYEKIYVSRSRLGGARVLANELDLEAVASSLGYQVIHPEQMTIIEQAYVFQRARTVVGPDGSGLHNIVFSHQITALGVIGSLERVNFWHAAICNALNAKIVFIKPTSTGRGEEISIPDFRSMLDYLSRIF